MRFHKVIKILSAVLFFLLISGTDAFSFSLQQKEFHHIFPKEHRTWFKERGIEPDLWCIPLTRERHTGAKTSIHHRRYAISNGQNFNDSWKSFMTQNPSASKNKCFVHAILLLGEFGIDLRKEKFYNYLTKQKTHVKIPTGKLIEIAIRFASKLGKLSDKLGKLSGRLTRGGSLIYVYAAWQLYDLGSAVDISFDESKFDEGMGAYIEGENLYYEGKINEARGKFMMADFLLGSVFHEEIMKQTTSLLSEIANKFHTDRQKKVLELCLCFLNNADKIKQDMNIVFPQIPLYIGEIFAVTGENRKAVAYLRDAEKEFAQMGKVKLAERVRELIDIL